MTAGLDQEQVATLVAMREKHTYREIHEVAKGMGFTGKLARLHQVLRAAGAPLVGKGTRPPDARHIRWLVMIRDGASVADVAALERVSEQAVRAAMKRLACLHREGRL